MVIHQTLHGYDGGHRLLASSYDLGWDADHLMLIASDLSGSGPVAAFDGYLTGYAVPSERKYALARTWYAHEVSRPGCVWTHSLLIDFVDLAKNHNLYKLLNLFARPSSLQFLNYQEPLATQSLDEQSPHPKHHSAGILVESLYRQELPVIVPAFESSEFENSTIAVWQQQWPRLRRTFSFCTGALSDRTKALNFSFDLQIVPSDRIELFRRQGQYYVADLRQGGLSSDVIDDAVAGGPSGLRAFTAKYGADVSSGRSCFLYLASLYHLSSTKATLQEEADVLRKIPTKDASTLRKSIFTPNHTDFGHGAYEVLFFLGTHEHWDELGLNSETIQQTVTSAFEQHRAHAIDAVRELLTVGVNELGDWILQFACRSLTVDELKTLNQHVPGSVVTFLAANPSLGEQETLWREFKGYQDELIDALAKKEAITEKTIKAIISSRNLHHAPRFFIERVGPAAVKALLEASTDSCDKIPQPWIDSFAQYNQAVVEWLSQADTCTPTQWFLISHLEYSTLLAVPKDAWDRCLPPSITPLGSKKQMAVAALFAYAVLSGVNNPKLLVLSFSCLHKALEGYNQLGYKRWETLSALLPPAEQWKEWDKCERLRRGLIYLWLKNEWPLELFVQAARPHLESVAQSASNLPQCKKIISQIHKNAKSGTIKLNTEEQQAIRNAHKRLKNTPKPKPPRNTSGSILRGLFWWLR